MVPVGRPIANIKIYILNRYLQPVPIQIPGEICIAGDGVGRGYLNRPELTAEKFIPNPFSSEPDDRLFKTGDLGRYLANGEIEFLGRIDHQVKIRGFRIELGEIEAVLQSHPQVQQTVVMVRLGLVNDKQLVAYVRTDQPAINHQDLRTFLQQRLPDYMVPSLFMILETFPLTPNGKINISALPSPEVLVQCSKQFIAPRTPIEIKLAKIWSEILGVNQIGVQDNFFEIGGHSLLAVSLALKIEQVFQEQLTLTTLLQNPTIPQQAHLLGS
jgi:acyl carrier protein